MASRTSNTERRAGRRRAPGRPHRHRRRHGFGIVESMMASTVLAIAVVGIAGPLSAASEQSEVVRERGAALVLARQLLEEIAAKPLCDGGTTCHLGPETASGETDRSKFDSADDYNQFHDATSGLRDLAGNRVAFDAAAEYTRDVTVEYRTSIAGAATTAGDFGLVTVRVTTPGHQVVTVSRLLCKSAQAF